MTDLRQAAQQALVALEGLFGLPNQWESGGVAVWRLGGSDASRQAITALKSALEQQAEPVAYFDFQDLKFSWAKHMQIGPVPVSIKVEPMKLYLEAPQKLAEPVADEAIHAAWSAGYVEGEKAALEQQAEPVAKLFGSLPVYDTAPPQRKELSASEILNMMPSTIPAEYDGELMEFARAVEAKLKERNT